MLTVFSEWKKGREEVPQQNKDINFEFEVVAIYLSPNPK